MFKTSYFESDKKKIKKDSHINKLIRLRKFSADKAFLPIYIYLIHVEKRFAGARPYLASMWI